MKTTSSYTRRKIRVLIVDDSALVRKILTIGLSTDPQLEVIGAARDPLVAHDLILKDRPDVITLDIEMPNMDGLTFLKQYMRTSPIPTLVLSALTEQGKKITIEALEAGAVEVVAKPKLGVMDELPAMMADLCERVKAVARVDVSRYSRLHRHLTTVKPPVEVSHALYESTDQVIAIGTSAGGVQALAHILPAFPATAPGMVIVQHMPADFTASFAARLNSLSAIQVKEAEHGDRVRPGLALLAPGGERHMEVHRSGGEYRVALIEGSLVTRHRPSVDVLFRSVAKYVGRNAAAALLTGMGEDGAQGLLAIRQAGGHTLAQDEATCVVFGMPGAAWQIGAAESLIPLDEVPRRLLGALRK